MHLLWLYPYALLALALLPLLALLQLFLPRTPRLRVSSLVFWPAAATAGLDQSGRRRRLDLAAILLLATLAAAILALAGPLLVRSKPAGPAGVIAIDRSPSLLMSDGGLTGEPFRATSRGGGPTRLERLRPQVDRFLASLPADTPVALDLLPPGQGPSPIFAGPAAQARRRLPDLLSAATEPLTVDDTRFDLDSLHARRAAPIAFFTDLSPYDADHSVPPFLNLVSTGGSAVSVALTNAAIAFRDGRPYALVSLFASPGFDRSVPLAVSGRRAAELAVRPGDSSFTLPLSAPLPDEVTFTLDLRDDFPLAHRLRLVRTEGRHYRVALVGRPDAALLRLLRAADAEVFLSPSPSGEGGLGEKRAGEGLRPTASHVDFTIFIDCLPPPDFAGPAAFVNPPTSPCGFLVATGHTGGPGNVKTIAGDPITANLPPNLTELNSWPVFSGVMQNAPVALSPSLDPLIVPWISGPSPCVAVLFDISRDNTRWSEDLSFVIFWSNCFRFLAPAAPAVTRYQPADPAVAALGETEGRQVRGPALDQSAAARAAFLAHDRDVRPTLFPLWAFFAAAAVVLLLVRLTVKSA
jgi:hypothetical protein